MFSSNCTLPSPTSAGSFPPLFGRFTGTTAQSDFSNTYTSVVRLSAFTDRPSQTAEGVLEISRFSCMLSNQRASARHGKPGSSLHANSVATLLKRAAVRAGIDPTNVAGHSVRAGMATQAAMNGAGERQIAKTTRHKSERVLRRYIRTGKLFRDNASATLGL